MKKDIYIIKNTVNDKVYIGQAKNSADRWCKHLYEARNKRRQVISKAMAEIGIEKFYYQILESQIENYNEREEYWIRKYNSVFPNGYNRGIGGVGNGKGTESPVSNFKDQETIDDIISDIRNTNLSFSKISEKYDCCEYVISQINIGEVYKKDGEVYPIRQTRKDKEVIKQLIYSLQYELDKSIQQISKEYNVEKSVVYDINVGNLHRIDGKQYPLRRGRVFSKIDKYVPEVKELLKHSDMQQKDIARKFNVSVSWVSSINKGSFYFSEEDTYPLRKNYQCNNGGRKSLSPCEIRKIEDLLKNHREVSIKKIAEMFEVSPAMIRNINTGSVIKFRNDNIDYPLRKIAPVSTIRG